MLFLSKSTLAERLNRVSLPQVSVPMSLIPCPCPYVHAPTSCPISLSPCSCGNVLVHMSLSPLHCLPVSVTMSPVPKSLSLSLSHPAPVPMSSFPCPSDRVTIPMPQYSCHFPMLLSSISVSVPILTSLFSYHRFSYTCPQALIPTFLTAFFYIAFPTSIFPCFFSHVPVLSLSPCSFPHVPFTISLSP